MSQEDVLDILKEIGGSATITEIRDKAKSKYPTRSLYSYVGNRLHKLKKWGDVTYREGKWRLNKLSENYSSCRKSPSFHTKPKNNSNKLKSFL